MDAHLAVWIDVGNLPAQFYDSITTRSILERFGSIIQFSQNFLHRKNMESFAVLMAVQSTRSLPEILRLKDGILNYNVSFNPVSVSAVAANVLLEEKCWEFITRGERLYRSELFDRP